MNIIAREENNNDLLFRLFARVVREGKTFLHCNFIKFDDNDSLAHTRAMVEIFENFSHYEIFQLLNYACPIGGTLLHRIVREKDTDGKEKLLLISRLMEQLPKGK